MMKFRKKPVVVEAIQWNDWNDRNIDIYTCLEHAVWGDVCPECGHKFFAHGSISTLKGVHIVCPGDWIITGVKGEKYPCKPDIFDATYERVEDSTDA